MQIQWRAAFVLSLAGICTAILAGCSACRAWDWQFWKKQKPAVIHAAHTLKGERSMSTATDTQKPLTATTDNFESLVLNSEVPVLVDFYADWCGPCRMLAPVLDELAAEVDDARIVKVNVDESPELAQRYGVSSIPSLKVFQQGRVSAQHAGLASKAQLKALLTK